MGTITITESLTGPAGNTQVSFVVDAEGIIVIMPSKPSYSRIVISWEQLDDVDALSEIFSDWTVREFKTVIPVLGKIYSNKHTFKEL